MAILISLVWVVIVSDGIITLYLLLTLLGGIIPVNKKYRTNSKGIEVYISSNGFHTDFIVPAINSYFDWGRVVDDSAYETPFTKQSFLGIGWGDKGFYLDTPTWAELKLKTALVAAFIPSPTCMHLTSYANRPDTNKFFECLYLTSDQYLILCEYISSYFETNDDKTILIPDVGYTSNDNFYESNDVYHAFNTCNFWVNRGLIKMGVRAALWSPLDRGMFYQLKRMKSKNWDR